MGWKHRLVRATLLVSVLVVAAAPLPAVAGAGAYGVGPYKVKDLRVVSGAESVCGRLSRCPLR